MILVAKQYRGNVVESFHIGYAVAVNDKSEVIFSAGETEYPVFIQSAAAPFQTAVLLESGAAEKFKLDDEDIAICCSSHNGEAFQAEAVANLLKKIGMNVDDLLCGVHPPFDKTSYEQLILQGRRATALHTNCSGTHAGMLALAKTLDVVSASYIGVEQPVQLRIFEKIKHYSGKDKIPMETDNCNAPTFFLPLFNLALMYRKLVEGADDYLQKIFHVMNMHPKHLAGKGRFDTDFVTTMHGRGVSKYGCEGVRGIGIRTDDGHTGIALKVLSGSWKAADSMSVAVLKHLKLLDEETLVKLEKYESPAIRSHSEKSIGHIETEIVIDET
ncbi:asparaginase [bacterium]|nr:asparaginase [bacterium]MBU1065318.1 asparaginase [bacterium]MBU1633758.1 asparaginase [bacterium]MBU1873026.1 asparaginase [bacterium]